jgi:hypothetical protein
MKTITICFLLVTILFSNPFSAHGAGYFGGDPETAPSVFTYAFRGFSIGTLLGLSAGYLGFRGEEKNWSALAIGSGVGAVVGAALGLGIGVYDLNQEIPGVGAIVLRDTLYGA